jgi:hypothetical protein
MSEHTPGPWHVEELTGIAVCRIHDTDVDSEDSWISNVYDDDDWGRCKANAYLMAASPDLLAVAKQLAHQGHSSECVNYMLEGCICGVYAAEAAIVKALGQRSLTASAHPVTDANNDTAMPK